ncbi:diguanylate cyclase [Lentibacter algarum]|uniref:GGDEF domain-containing protein n=1 Tax=Lentibacter algarum TaxID=576131 RepID=UPI001C07B48A|nr:diguanylate cyclase [Lentibacter algarum]MBU2982204.1 diguanylate cyclase [Lentibacter algarum]
MLENPFEVLIAITFGAGVMALLAMSYGVVVRSEIHKMWQSVILGFVFAFGAVMVMMEPVHLGEGVIFDARAIIVGLAAAFGGWPAGLLSAFLTALYRFYLGGAGAPSGILGIFLSAALGLLWAWRLKPKGRLNVRATATLGAAISLYTCSAVLLPQEIIYDVVTKIVPIMVIGCIICAIVMGSFLERECSYIHSEKTWREDARTDPLTALPNRRGFFDKVERELSEAERHETDVFLVLDADHFKRVNDNHGHSAGDAALIVIADKLKLAAGKKGSVCRLGGEEFAVFLPATTQSAANQIAGVLLSRIRDAGLTFDGVAVELSVSIGAVVRSAASKAPLSSCLQSADNALYRAKVTGRDKVVFAQPLEA